MPPLDTAVPEAVPQSNVAESGSGSGLLGLTERASAVGATVSVRDLNRDFDWNLPDEEATTIAGLVIHEARTIPEVGQRFAFFGFKFEILRRQRNQITALRVTAPSETTDTVPPG